MAYTSHSARCLRKGEKVAAVRKRFPRISRRQAYVLRNQPGLSYKERKMIRDRAVKEAVRKLLDKPKKYRRGQKKLPWVVAYPETLVYMKEHWRSLAKGLTKKDIPSRATFYRILKKSPYRTKASRTRHRVYNQ